MVVVPADIKMAFSSLLPSFSVCNKLVCYGVRSFGVSRHGFQEVSKTEECMGWNPKYKSDIEHLKGSSSVFCYFLSYRFTKALKNCSVIIYADAATLSLCMKILHQLNERALMNICTTWIVGL